MYLETNDALNESDKGAFFRIFVVSDSIGDTASALVDAAVSQFDGLDPNVLRLPKVFHIDQVRNFVGAHTRDSSSEIMFMTIADPELARDTRAYADELGMVSVDLLSSAVAAIAKVTGKAPSLKAGINHKLDESYFKRIEAMDFTADHDDGRNPEGYKDADIIVMGVSRSSKTPLSMYLASSGYKVANLPLAPGMNPPKQIFEVEPWRVFGLMSSPEVLVDIRRRRLGAEGMRVAGEYASVEYIERDLEEARAFMRKIGCIVVRTDNRAIEETAQEILGYYNMALQAVRNQEE